MTERQQGWLLLLWPWLTYVLVSQAMTDQRRQRAHWVEQGRLIGVASVSGAAIAARLFDFTTVEKRASLEVLESCQPSGPSLRSWNQEDDICPSAISLGVFLYGQV